MAKLCLLALLLAILHLGNAQESVGCNVTTVCGGPSQVSASVVIDPREISGQLIDFFACQCTNGTRLAVSKDASIVIPLPDSDAAAPGPSPSNKPRFDPQTYALSLKTRYPTQCNKINMTLLDSPNTNPAGCNITMILGQTCRPTCRFTMRALGLPCYAVAVAVGLADPRTINSNTTVVFNQCTTNRPYTTASEWVPMYSPPPAPQQQSPSVAPAVAPSPAPSSSSPVCSSSLAVLVLTCFLLLLGYI